MSIVPGRLRRVHVVVAVLLTMLAVSAGARSASAHTDFDFSSPADGMSVAAPLSEIVVDFTTPAAPSGGGFELLDPSGAVRAPTSLDETDGTSFVMAFDPPLEAGSYGVRWEVQAGDAHPIAGSFQFEVVAPSSPTVSSAPITVAAAVAVATTSPTTPPTTPPTSTIMDAMVMDGTSMTAMGSDGIDEAASATAMDEFMHGAGAGGDAVSVGRVGRIISIAGLVIGLGVLAALVWTIRGRRDELRRLLAWVRLAGLVVVAGGFVEFAALTDVDESVSMSGWLGTKPGIATALKMAGGMAVLSGFSSRAGRFVAPARSLSSAVASDLVIRDRVLTGATDGAGRTEGEHRWTPSSTSVVGIIGFGLAVVSYSFDGHTVSSGPWAIHSLVNVVHLGAAAVWGGGVFAMTSMAWMRRRRSQHVGLAAMVVRFSSSATVSLVAVTLAGLAMTWMILDQPSDLISTPWGQLLCAKTAVVAIAAGLGGYNHFRLRPALEQRPDDPSLARDLRSSLAIESAAFAAIIALTAVLVAAAA